MYNLLQAQSDARVYAITNGSSSEKPRITGLSSSSAKRNILSFTSQFIFYYSIRYFLWTR